MSCCTFTASRSRNARAGSDAAFGQQTTATVTGQVTDPSGSIVTGARVTLTNTDTNTSGSTTTGSSGDYVLTLLRPGPYTLLVTSVGFQEYSQSGIVLEINQTMKIDVALTIGQVTQKTEVTGEPSVIVTENRRCGKVIDNESITQLPLNGRLNIMGLMSLAPGIQNAGSQDQVPYFGITPTVYKGAPPQDPWHFPWTGLRTACPGSNAGSSNTHRSTACRSSRSSPRARVPSSGKANQVIVAAYPLSGCLLGFVFPIFRSELAL